MKAKQLKLSYKNDWEHISYLAGGQTLDNLKDATILGKKYKVYSRKAFKDYNDMGHTYTASFTQFYINHKVFNKVQSFNLESLIAQKVSILVDIKEITKRQEK